MYLYRTKYIYLFIALLVLLVIVGITIYDIDITKTGLETGFSAFKFILNIKIFLPYIKLLFSIWFIIQHLITKYSIEKDPNQRENYRLWKLGKIFIYYDNERKEMKKKLEELEDKYNKSYLSLNNTNEFFNQRHE